MTHANFDPHSIEAALTDPAFAPLSGGPILVAGGSPLRVLHASQQALALFRVADADALTQRLFAGAEPGARRLAELAANLAPGAPRLEKLRFYVGGASEAITFQCKRIPSEPPLFVAAAIGVRPALLASPPAQPPAPVSAPADASAQPNEISEPNAIEVSRPRGNVRFLWKTDADLRFTHFDESGCKALGRNAGSLLGKSILELAGLPGFDPDGRLCAALLRRETWSGVEVNWPIDGANECAPVVMGALPTFDKARAFTGFSGFGVIHLDRIAERRQPANDQLAADVADGQMAGDPTDETSAADESALADLTAVAAPLSEPSASDKPEADKPAEAAAIAETLAKIAAELKANSSAQDNEVSGSEDEPLQGDMFDEQPSADEPVEDDVSIGAETVSGAFSAPNVVALNAWKTTTAPVSQQPAADKHLPAAPAEAPKEAPTRDEFPSREGEEEELVRLTPTERHAFREIARALGARVEDAEKRRGRRDERKTDAPAAEAPAARNTDELIASMREELRATRSTPVFAKAPKTPAGDATRHLLDRIDAALMVCREGEAVFLNKALLETLGYESLEAFTAMGGVPRMFRGRTPEMATSGGAVPVVRANGDIVALEGRLTAIEWDGAPAMLTTFRNPAETELTTRVRALELDLRARESEGRELHAILDTATDGVAILDGQGRILGLNRSAEALFGYEQNEVAGEAFTILFATESHPAAIDYLSGLKTNGVRSVLNDGRDVIGRARQGGVIPIFMTIGRIGAEPASKFCVVMRDMTQWKNAERDLNDARREAEKASALKSEFLAKISHEIRTPLNAIIGFTEVILEERFGPVSNDRYKDYLKDIHASGAHVMSLVNDLLDLSKIEAGKLELNFGSVDANRIINECVSMMQAQAIRERVIIRLSLAPRFPNIVADERALRQIVLNLLSNAVKFNQPGGQVIVSTALTDAGSAVLRVRDNGIGMSDGEIEMALEPFRQIQTSRQTTGTGLGLPLTKALVEANRAAFVIRSRKGEGTLVEVSFPSTRVLAE
jgi:PAS domain S-box-containing protein